MDAIINLRCFRLKNGSNNRLVTKFRNFKRFFIRKDLTIETPFLHNFKLSFLNVDFEQKIEISYRLRRCCMYLFFYSQSTITHSDLSKLIAFTEVSFGHEKILRKVSWCPNYFMDKKQSVNFHLDFSFFNHSIKRKIMDDDQAALRCAAFNCCSCNLFH